MLICAEASLFPFLGGLTGSKNCHFDSKYYIYYMAFKVFTMAYQIKALGIITNNICSKLSLAKLGTKIRD